MNMELGLYQEQTQKLIMTMQMKQAIQMLQCTAEELDEYLMKEFNENPLLQYTPATAVRDYLMNPRAAKGHRDGSQPASLDQFARAEETMFDALERQISVQNQPQHILRAAQKLLGCLNESGYLVGGQEELQAVCQCNRETLDGAVAVIQNCDPVGIGARNLKECLLLQVDQFSGTLRGQLRAVIANHLEDVANGKLQRIARDLDLTLQDVQELIDHIRHLNPRPAASLGQNSAQYVVPDILVRQVDGVYQIYTNTDAQPKVGVDRTYESLLRERENPDARRFLQQKLQSIHWIRKSLEQRQTTLVRVAEAIVSVQYRFFTEGPAGLKPLTLKQVADAVELHESTVSRTVRGKYMETPLGVFELKYFFTSELHSNSGTVSAHSVKHLIRTWVDSEDTLHPLSDEALSKQLQEHGIRVSRRTVAKYRDEMRIPASSKRRRYA